QDLACFVFFFFSSRRRHTRWPRDWSSDVCSSDLQDVMTLLKKEHGIEVKSASITIAEVVAREFVAKQARQRGLKVPSNASFADRSEERRVGKECRARCAGERERQRGRVCGDDSAG